MSGRASSWADDGSQPVLETTVGGILAAAATQAPETVAPVESVADPSAE